MLASGSEYKVVGRQNNPQQMFPDEGYFSAFSGSLLNILTFYYTSAKLLKKHAKNKIKISKISQFESPNKPQLNPKISYMQQKITFDKQIKKSQLIYKKIEIFKMKPSAVPKKFNPDDYVTMTIPREEVVEIKQAFDIFDDDGSGMLDPAELKQAFIKLGFSGQNKFVYQILAELDEDQSGGIDFPQFLRLATAKISEKDSRAEVNKVFNSFDVNRCGKITSAQLKKVARDLGEDMTDQQINVMFAKADLDDDGFVTADDFYNMMTHRVYWDSVK